MFIVHVTYVKPLGEIDALLEAHARFLDEHYAAGLFLASGRRIPRTGGVILARAGSREDLERVLALDPFAAHGAATYDVVEFIPTKTASELEFLREPPCQ